MPQQVIRPAARLAFEVDVLAPKEERLHDQLLELQFAGLDTLVHPLMRRIEPPGVPRHGDLAGGPLRSVDTLGIGQ